MKLLVNKLVENTAYTKGTIDKMLTINGISNHFEVTMDELIILYKNTKNKNHKSWTLRNYLEDIIPKEELDLYIQ